MINIILFYYFTESHHESTNLDIFYYLNTLRGNL